MIRQSAQLRHRLASLTRKDSYAYDTFINTLGLLVAAALSIAALPILSRLYPPSEFGVFGVFSAFVSLGTIAATGRYEAAIVLPVEDRDAGAVAAVAGVFALGGTTLLLIMVAILYVAGVTMVREHLLLSGLAVLTIGLAASFQVLLNSAIRYRLFGLTSIARVAGAVTMAALSISFGLMDAGEVGLPLGVTGNYLISGLVLVFALRGSGRVDGIPSRSRIAGQAKRFRHFPLFSLPSDFINTLASQLPVLFFSTFFGATAAGYLTMFQRVWAGSGILVQGLGETFRQRAAVERQETGTFRRTMLVTVLPLGAVAMILLVVLGIFGPDLFALFAGEQWREAGIYGQILAPMVCAQFVASPVSWAFYIAERLRLMMVWQWVFFAAVVLAGFIGTGLLEERGTLVLLSAVGCVLYLIYAGLSLRLSRDGVS
jgi:O-antigen/teichoic acid export membrane protein